jgi:hypothetical protein
VERVLWPVNLAVFAIGAIQFWRSGRKARAKLVCAVMLKHLRCPHCGYDIRGLPSSPDDGATICPECGSAWRLEDMQPAEERGNVVFDVPSAGDPSSPKVNDDG